MKQVCYVLIVPALLLVLLSYPSFCLARTTNQLSHKAKQLQKINQQINSLQQTLNNARDKRETLLHELKKTEIDIGHLAKNLRTLSNELDVEKLTIDHLQQQAQKQQEQLREQKILLAKQVRASYQLGQHEYIKLLLNQENPNTLSRFLTYYAYLNRARVKLIKAINTTLQALLSSKEKIVQHSQQLQHLVSQQQETQEILEMQHKYRQRVIAQLNKQIKSKDQNLANLLHNKKALEKVIQRLQQTTKTLHYAKRFSQMKRQLNWPTQGQVINFFGKPIDGSHLLYNGILIKAPSGQAVHAVYPGRVVFSNWLRGYGLLLIIEHGEGYMTLYAHNHSLYKKKGDTVTIGNLIATIGHSGGNKQNGLYFEIRYKGKPLNPIAWCKALNNKIKFANHSIF